MGQEDQKRTERMQVNIPVRVIGTSPEAGEFTEDTRTVAVSQAGARLSLSHSVVAGETVRIINLRNYSEADFRVVGLLGPAATKPAEWGVECVERGRNIWGVDLPPVEAGAPEAGVRLECRACHDQGPVTVTLMEIEVLDSTGLIVRECTRCGKPTYWVYADTARRPRQLSPSEPVTPASATPASKKSEKRAHRRVTMRVPILVRNQKNEQEISKTENMSKDGVAVSLAMELTVGDQLTIVCPYAPSGQNIEQKAEVRWRSAFPFGGMRSYGLQFVG